MYLFPQPLGYHLGQRADLMTEVDLVPAISSFTDRHIMIESWICTIFHTSDNGVQETKMHQYLKQRTIVPLPGPIAPFDTKINGMGLPVQETKCFK
jgi:hypothetical protein